MYKKCISSEKNNFKLYQLPNYVDDSVWENKFYKQTNKSFKEIYNTRRYKENTKWLEKQNDSTIFLQQLEYIVETKK